MDVIGCYSSRMSSSLHSTISIYLWRFSFANVVTRSLGGLPRYPHSTTKGTRISVLKIANIGVNIREIRRSLKVGKRVPFLTENSRKVEKRVLFGRPLPCSGGIFIFFIYLCLLYMLKYVQVMA